MIPDPAEKLSILSSTKRAVSLVVPSRLSTWEVGQNSVIVIPKEWAGHKWEHDLSTVKGRPLSPFPLGAEVLRT